MLAFTTPAVDDRDPVRSGKAMHSSAEATSHPHQVRVIEVLFGAIVQTSPPFSKAASRVTQRVERVEDDAIDAGVAPLQQLAITLAEVVGHPARIDGSAPSGATGFGPRTKTSVASCASRSCKYTCRSRRCERSTPFRSRRSRRSRLTTLPGP